MSLTEAQKREGSLIVFACLSREDLLWELLARGGNSKKWMELGFTEVPLKAIRESFLENEGGERKSLCAVLALHDLIHKHWSPTECMSDDYIKDIRPAMVDLERSK